MKEALKFVGGSVAVYVVMVACSSKAPTPDVGSYVPSKSSSGGASMMAGGGMGNGGLAQVGGDTSSMAGQLGASGQADGTDGGTANGSGGSGTHDAGVMDAMADAMSDATTDPTPDASAQEMSGSRLKARYYVGEDGSKQFVGWYDSQRKENCSTYVATDGTMRCMPTLGGASGGSYYSDSGCTQMLFVAAKPVSTGSCATSSAPPPSYGYAATTCGYSFYTLSATTPGSMVYVGTPANCIAAATPTSTYNFYTGAEVSPSSFVKITEQVD